MGRATAKGGKTEEQNSTEVGGSMGKHWMEWGLSRGHT